MEKGSASKNLPSFSSSSSCVMGGGRRNADFADENITLLGNTMEGPESKKESQLKKSDGRKGKDVKKVPYFNFMRGTVSSSGNDAWNTSVRRSEWNTSVRIIVPVPQKKVTQKKSSAGDEEDIDFQDMLSELGPPTPPKTDSDSEENTVASQSQHQDQDHVQEDHIQEDEDDIEEVTTQPRLLQESKLLETPTTCQKKNQKNGENSPQSW